MNRLHINPDPGTCAAPRLRRALRALRALRLPRSRVVSVGSGRSARARVIAGLALMAAAVFAPAGLQGQRPPPDGAWLTLETAHFSVTFPPELEGLGREAASVAEAVYEILQADLAPAPEGRIEVVVTDHVDYTNGYATPFPSNRIVLFARPPLDVVGLSSMRDWMELVVAHELVHIFHLDVAGPVGRGIRAIFGRLPLFWPVFPVIGTPTWSLEGLATHYESRLTGAGRVHGSFHDMVVRTAALEEEIPPLGRVTTPSPVWPAGQRSYIYGASFMRWLAEEYGPDIHARLVEATADAILPTFLFFGEVAETVTGSDFGELYEAWRAEATREAEAVREAVTTAGVVEGAPVTGAGERTAPFAVHPRVGPDGARVAFSADDFRSDPATRLLDVGTGRIRTVARRNQAATILGPAAWLPDGSGLVTAQLDFQGPYRLYTDLWLVDLDGRETRLTAGARLDRPDVAADGRRVVAIESRDGAMNLVVHDLVSGRTTTIVRAAAGQGFTAPRWSPDGHAVAAARFQDGQLDLVVVDVASGAVRPLTSDDAVDHAPAWTPDGRYILFWSDRTGIPNLFAADLVGGIRQVTNVLGGAFDPDVSPDGEWIYYSSYHAGGWRLERLRLRPESWRPAPAPTLDHQDGLLPPPPPAADLPLDSAPAEPAAVDQGVLTPYSPVPSLGPTFWAPSYRTLTAGADELRFLGARSMGWDVLDRHRWQASAAAELGSGRLDGDVAWTWRGLGNPVLTFSLARDWGAAGALVVEDDRAEGIWLREDRAAVDALYLRRGWRSTAWLQGGVEAQGRRYDLHRGGDEGDAILEAVGLHDLPGIVGAVGGAGWSNANAYPYSISLEDGIAVSGSVRRWWGTDGFERTYDQLQGRLSAYRGFAWWGFADHVLAGRASGLLRTGPGAIPTSIGGGAGSPAAMLGDLSLEGVRIFLPVRGYPEGARIGTRAWTASAEYRVPLHLTGWRGDLFGLSITALSGALFADAGDAWCEDPVAGCRSEPGDPLLSAGAELSVDFGVLHSIPIRIRGGVAVPFTATDPEDSDPAAIRNWKPYFAFGPSF